MDQGRNNADWKIEGSNGKRFGAKFENNVRYCFTIPRYERTYLLYMHVTYACWGAVGCVTSIQHLFDFTLSDLRKLKTLFRLTKT